jgi:beta-glucosidase-like glycosyl hydrolase/CubicO group peptidase (beta-lactamase class C family)
MKQFIIALLICIFIPSITFGEKVDKEKKKTEKEIEKLLSQMTIKEMVGQLIMIGADTDVNKKYCEKILKDIDSNKVGGVCFFKGKSDNLPKLINKYNTVCKIPLLVSIDAEWSLSMRFTDLDPFPRAMALGALDSNDYYLVYKKADIIGKQCKTLGIHINFAPDIDINLNPANPVINTRSFGQNKWKVSLLSEQYIKGLQDNNVMAVIKHFPGHGDTDLDSHLNLPTINHSKDFIDTVDLIPFKYNIEKGVWGAMIAHLNVPALNKNYTYPASINPDIIQGYLVDELKFDGLIFTDAMNMKGLTNDYPDGQAQVLALKAGVDVLLMPNNTDSAMNAILTAIENGELSKELIKEKCRKVLEWKYKLGVMKPTQEPKPLSKKQKEEIGNLCDSIAPKVLTLLENNANILPLEEKDTNEVIFVSLDENDYSDFIKQAKKHKKIKNYCINKKTKEEDYEKIMCEIDSTKTVIVAASGGVNSKKSNNYGISSQSLTTLYAIQETKAKNILVLFANPYVLESIDTICDYNALIIAYQNTPQLQVAAAKSIFTPHKFTATLPVDGSQTYKASPDFAIELPKQAPSRFSKIDSLINLGIVKEAYPGAQVLIAQKGEIIYKKNAGYQTYDNKIAINDSSIYDVASLTKVMATTLAVMKLYDEKKFALDDRLSNYIPWLKKTNKRKITIKEALSHCGRMKAYLPIWIHALKTAEQDSTLFAWKTENTDEYFQLTDSLYIHKKYREDIFKQISDSPLNPKHKYVYSDLGFILLGELVEALSGQTLDVYLEENFYKPMNLTHTCFRPKQSQNIENIVPTIEAVDFRNSQIRGNVHDETSALLGGVAGHAGLFSTSEDLFAICQMLLNKGEYKGKRYINKETVDLFAIAHFKEHNNRRGLGWDKPLLHSKSSHTSQYASKSSFGHSGFTGTYLWIDPKNETILIFLSNRVYPDAKTNKLAQLNIRTDIHDLIYEILKDESK